MLCWLKTITVLILALTIGAVAYAQDGAREQLKGLDEQIQEIKSDVLSIAAELNQLEERLLFPSNTQVCLFVSLDSGETFRLDSVQIQWSEKPVAHHIYTFKELEALKKGGVQRIYTGNVRAGDHALQVSMAGKSTGGDQFQHTQTFKVNKGIGPKIVEIRLKDKNITLKDG